MEATQLDFYDMLHFHEQYYHFITTRGERDVMDGKLHVDDGYMIWNIL